MAGSYFATFDSEALSNCRVVTWFKVPSTAMVMEKEKKKVALGACFLILLVVLWIVEKYLHN